ncbi:hypothetical protein [Curtobacterium sp. 24E2]
MTTTARSGTTAPPRTRTGGDAAVRRRPREKHPWTPAEKRRLRVGIAFISPWILGVLVFIAYP